jgi:hypothetical protein
VLAQLGCSTGACHGAKDGKAGFKLSLRGYDPIFDVRSLVDDHAGRRMNFASPDDSLMLLKSTGAVPHEGGQRTKFDDKYYRIMRAWIADGAKLDLSTPRVTRIEVTPQNPVLQAIGAKQQMRIIATYADGRQRDVTAEGFIESGNQDVALTERGGLVSTLRRGEAPSSPATRATMPPPPSPSWATAPASRGRNRSSGTKSTPSPPPNGSA